MIIGSGIFALLFLGGWNPLPGLPLANFVAMIGVACSPILVGIISVVIMLSKIIALLFFFMWVRWTVPRFRYDQVMKLGWQRLLPLAICNLIVYLIVIALIQK